MPSLTSLRHFLAVFVLSLTASGSPLPMIIDTDANNEIDDQHALAYALLNPDVFEVLGVTANRTRNGGGVELHVEEALRVVAMCGRYPEVPVYSGADGSFAEIEPHLADLRHDGYAAVDFIIREARRPRDGKLVLLPIGKMTNIALALTKAPDIIDRVKVVWLGSNYPAPGEYNLVSDETSINPVTASGVEQEWVTVRYGEPSGSDAVRITPAQVKQRMAGQGPKAVAPVPGRHGGHFSHFGDYAYSLFQNIELHGNPPSRALFDVVALAVLKEPSWGEAKTIDAPYLAEDGSWEMGKFPGTSLVLWENFDTEAIVEDFFATIAGD